jgi:hypothetical protein
MKRAMHVILLLVTGIVLFGSVSASAQSNGLGITPRRDYTVKAGDHVDDKLFISNLSQSADLRVSIRIVDFKAQDETGTPSLQLALNAQQTPWSLKPFLKVPATQVIPAGKSVYVPITIQVPKEQGAGSYYSAIEYVAENAQTQQKVNISASSASLVFLTVPGQAHEQLSMKQFGTYVPATGSKAGFFKDMFVSKRPTELAYRLQNNGNVAEQPQGSVLIKNIFGKNVKTIKKANPRNQLTLIGQTRRFEVCIEEEQSSKVASNGQAATQTICKTPSLLPGRYTAELAAFYGLNGSTTQEVSATASFWYLPWWSIVVLVAALLVIIGILWLIIRKARRNSGRNRKGTTGAGGSPVSIAPTQQPVEPAKPTNDNNNDDTPTAPTL